MLTFMGRKINLSHLSEDECEMVLSVLQRDFGIRQKEKDRISKLEDEVRVEVSKSDILAKQKTFNDNHCIRCLAAFSFFFNKKVQCHECQLYACKKCCQWEPQEKTWVCNFCVRQRELKLQSCEWFYSNIRSKFKRFGSAKVVRSLSKHCGDSDSENDSGYDPSLSSARETNKDRSLFQDLCNSPSVKSSDKLTAFKNVPSSSQDLNASDLLERHLNINKSEEQVRDHIENMIENIIGKGLQETSVERLYKNKHYETQEVQRLRNRILEIIKDLYNMLQKSDAAGGGAYERILHTYKGRLSEALTNLARSLHLAINNKPLDDVDSPMNAHVTIKRIINEVIEDAMGMPVLKSSDEESNSLKPEDEYVDEFTQTYEDLLASAIVNKIVGENQASKDRTQEQIIEEAENKLEAIKSQNEKQLQTEIVFSKNKTKKENKKIQADVPSDIEEEEDDDDETDSNMSDETDSITAELAPEKRKRRNSLEFVVAEEIEIIEESIESDEENQIGVFLKPKNRTSRIVGVELKPPPKVEFTRINSEEESVGTSDVDAEVIRSTSSPWQENWLLGDRRTVSPYTNVDGRKIHSDSETPICMLVPEPMEPVVPKVGQMDADKLSDLSERSSSDLSSEDDSELSSDEKSDGKTTRALRKLTKEIVSEFSKSKEESRGLHGSSRRKSLINKENLIDPLFYDYNFGTMMNGAKKDICDDPIFLVPPENCVIRAGKTARFSCRVRGSKPIDVLWFHNSVEIENDGKYQLSRNLEHHMLDIYDTERSDTGTIMCVAVSKKGECRSLAELRVRESRTPHKLPEFIYEMENCHVPEGEAAEFTCQVTGHPEPQIKFYKDGDRIYGNEHYQIEYLGSGEWSFLIMKTTLRDSAEYMCVAMNKIGQATSIARLTVAYRDLLQRHLVSRRSKESQQISNLTHKLSMTQDQVLESAEDMLSSANQMSTLEKQLIEMNTYLNNLESAANISNDTERKQIIRDVILQEQQQKQAASGIRRATGAALDLLDSEEVKLRNKSETSIVRPSTMIGEISQREKEKWTNAPKDIYNPYSADNIAKRRRAFMMTDSNMSYEDFEKLYYSGNILASDVEKLPEGKKIDCGLKKVDSKRYKRDYYVNSNGKVERKWEVETSKATGPPVNRQIQGPLDETEEQVYMAAGKIFTLEERIRMLETHVGDAAMSAPNRRLDELEDNVASAVAQVAQSEKHVSKVENRVTKLNKLMGNLSENSSLGISKSNQSEIPSSSRTVYESERKSTSPKINISQAHLLLRSNSLPSPEVSNLRDYNKNSGRGSLEDLFRTESRQSPSGSSGREDRYSDSHKSRYQDEDDWSEDQREKLLPSVKKLTAQFSFENNPITNTSSVKQIHSLTARHVPREFREALRQQNTDTFRSRDVTPMKPRKELGHSNQNV